MANVLDSVSGTIKNWWLTVALGALMIGTSLYLFTEPEGGYAALSVVFSIVFLLSGIFLIAFSISNSDEMKGWGWYLVLGILSLISGMYLLAEPELSELSLSIFVAMFFLFQSVGAIGASLDLKDQKVKGWGWLMTLGILGVIISFALFRRLDVAAMSLVVLTGINFLLIGIVFVIFGFQLRKIKRFPNKVSKEVKDRVNDLQGQIKKLQNQVQEELNNASSDSNSQ